MTTILEIIDGGTRYLEKRGIDDARTCMQLLVSAQLGITRTQIYMDFDQPLPEQHLAPLREMLKRRGEGEPLQHILGQIEFCGFEFKCDNRALVPRPETEELVEICSKFKLPESPQILDLCCGSGVIGLSLAKMLPEAEVTLSDISPACIELTSENARQLDIPRIKVRESDLFDAIPESFDLIVSNPPYIASGEKGQLGSEVDHDPEDALYSGEDGLDCVRQIVSPTLGHLHSFGILALEIGHDQAAAVEQLMLDAGFIKTRIVKDLSGVQRFVLGGGPEKIAAEPEADDTSADAAE